VSESSSATERSLLLGFSIPYSARSQSSNVRWVCCWRNVISIRRRTKWAQTVGRHFLTCERANLWSDPFSGQRGQVRAPSSGSEPRPTPSRKSPRTMRPARIPICG
jgi:hypothetical protein